MPSPLERLRETLLGERLRHEIDDAELERFDRAIHVRRYDDRLERLRDGSSKQIEPVAPGEIEVEQHDRVLGVPQELRRRVQLGAQVDPRERIAEHRPHEPLEPTSHDDLVFDDHDVHR